MIGFLKFGASGALIGALAFMLWQQRADHFKTKITALEIQLRACKASQLNISEDRKSDATIDHIPDDGLRDVPDRWIVQP